MSYISRRKFNRIPAFILLIALLLACLPAKPAKAETATSPPGVPESSVIILESHSGKELYSKMADAPIGVGSLLPMLIALTVLDEKEPEDLILINDDVKDMNTKIVGSTGDVGLTAGERLTVRQLLSAVLMASSQDACQALSGAFLSKETFLAKIQAKAAELELSGTEIRSYLSGDPDPGQTTVRDLAKTMQLFLKSPVLVEIARQSSVTFIPNNMVPEPRNILNLNEQIQPESKQYMKEALAGFISQEKTSSGSISQFISAMEFPGGQFITAIAGSSPGSGYSSSRSLLTWASSNFQSVQLIAKGETMSQLPLANGVSMDLIAEKDFYLLNTGSVSSKPEFSINFIPSAAPAGVILENQVMGTAEIIVNEKVESTINLLASRTIDLTALQAPKAQESTLSSVLGWFFWILLIVSSLAIALLILRTVRLLRRSRRRQALIRAKRDRLREQREREEKLKEKQQVINRSNF